MESSSGIEREQGDLRFKEETKVKTFLKDNVKCLLTSWDVDETTTIKC